MKEGRGITKRSKSALVMVWVAVAVLAMAGAAWAAGCGSGCPTIEAPSPAADSTTVDTTPTIAATVKDRQTNLAEKHIKLFVNGSGTTFFYDRATDRLSHTPEAPLGEGGHIVKIVARDNARNVSRKVWTFSLDTTTTPPPTPKVVALTFDDGPDSTNTRAILDILKSNNVKATFFVTGQRVNSYPALVRMEYAEGHIVANHTYTHPHLTTLSDPHVEQELADTNTAIVAAGAPKPNLFRPPYGETNATVEGIGASIGLTQALWDVDSTDWTNPPPSTICERVVSGVSPGSVVLLHDGWTTNTDEALPCIISELKGQGYSFGLVYPSSTYDPLNRSYVEIR